MLSGGYRARWARWFVRAVVSAIVITVLLKFIPVRAVMDALARVSASTWISSVAIFFAGHYLNALKLRLLLGDAGSHLMSKCVRAQYAGLVANLGLPGIAGGDLVRAVYLAPTAGVARVTVASVADRIIDSSTLLVLVAVALPIAGMPPAIAHVVSAMERLGVWIGVGMLLAIAAAVIAWRLAKGGAIASKAAKAKAILSERRGALAGAVAISFAVQSAFVMTNVWLAREVGVNTGVAAWFVAWPLSKLIAILPISLGGIGVREAALVSLLAPYGAANNAVLASGILWQSVLIVTGLVGLAITQLLPGAPVRDARDEPARASQRSGA